MAQPNLLIILSDQLRRDALSCYGDPNLSTPHIDTLARQGVRFDAACSTYPICVPYRFTFMTGHYAHSRMVPGIVWRMSPAERTLADEFNESGYESIYVGKWHLYGGLGAWVMKRPVPREHQGRWQKWFGFEFRNAPFDTCYFEDADPTPRQIEGYQTDGLFDVGMDYIGRRDRSRPFAMVLSVEPPHPPLEAPRHLEEKWRGRDIKLPENFMVPAEPRDQVSDPPAPPQAMNRDRLIKNRRQYYAMVENLDDNVGRLMKHLRDTGLADNTIVVLTADHGELGGSHMLTQKQYAYEESAGVPLIMSGERCGLPTGRVVADPTCTEDLFPTFLGLAGLTPRPREPLYGADLSPLARGQVQSLARSGVMLEFVLELREKGVFHDGGYRAWRSNRYKYVARGGGKEGMKPWQFFDLQADPQELKNLIADPNYAPQIREHHGWLRERMVQTGDHANLGPAFGYEGLNMWVVG
jgi:arylsulfatase A-like enzyme